MNNTVERLRYFDGEYLRANDFKTEQSYHAGMRRRLNRELHLYGIVEGLELVPDADSFPPAAVQFSITAGFAIDQLGREIVISQPYALANDVVLRRKGVQTGTYELWICYQEQASGLPSAGYSTCNQSGENTRYEESFDIVLVPSPKPAAKAGVTISDPSNDCGGLRLGTFTVANDASGLRIASAVSEHRTYIGLRTQSIVAPDENVPPFDVLSQNVIPTDPPPPPGYLDIQPNVYARGNVLMTQNAVVGDDFLIDTSKTKSPLPATLDKGNLKVSENIFLNGDFFANIAGQWYGMSDFVRTFLPDFKFDSKTITVDPGATSPATGLGGPFAVTSKLPNVSAAQIQVGLTGIIWKDLTNAGTWLSTVSTGTPVQVSVAGSVARQGGSLNTFNVSLFYTVGPKDNPANPNDAIVLVDQLIVNYIVIFFP